MQLDDEEETEIKIRDALRIGNSPSAAFEAALFSKANDLLTQKRSQILDRALAKSRVEVRRRELVALPVRVLLEQQRYLAISAPIQAAALLVLTSSVYFIHSRATDISSGNSGVTNTALELPDFPKTNDASARYEAQRQLEEQNYENEVEDAHQKTNGGV